MTKILWHSNAPHAPTGYGQQTALFAPKLAEHYQLFLSANYGLEGAPLVWNGIPVLPGLGGSHGNETLPGHVQAVFDNPREGLVVTLYDAQVFDPNIIKRFNTACWVPIDHNPSPPALVAFFRNSQAIPVAMSRFGQEQLGEFDPLYVPHGVDADIYKPTPGNVREQMGLPEDVFLVGMVAANKGRPSRKCFQQAMEAFRHFHKRHSNAVLYLHTTLSAEYANGEDLATLAASLQIPEEAIRFPNQYSMMFAPLQRETMAQIYSAFDVLLNPSMGEGFGVPIIEAAACGTPAVVTDFSAMPEVAGPGWKVGCRPYWTAQASWMGVPDVGEIVGALEECYGLSEVERKVLAKKCRDHALDYAAPKVFTDYMLPALEEVEERIGARLPEKVEVAA